MTHITSTFESDFLETDLAVAIAGCGENELAGLIEATCSKHQPVLEAGCGSGKWMHYLKQRGIESIGIDWSAALQRRSVALDPAVRFDVGDLRTLPYDGASIGSVLALGSIEHVVEGPHVILRELHRVLRPGGPFVITVPHMAAIKRVRDGFKANVLRENARIRSLLGKEPVRSESLREVLGRSYSPNVKMDVVVADGEYAFYQYVFSPSQLGSLLSSSGFEVHDVFPTGSAYGIWDAARGVVGRFDRDRQIVQLNAFGRLLDRLLPARATGHMLCAVGRRP